MNADKTLRKLVFGSNPRLSAFIRGKKSLPAAAALMARC